MPKIGKKSLYRKSLPLIFAGIHELTRKITVSYNFSFFNVSLGYSMTNYHLMP
jgi:hypothetical protein